MSDLEKELREKIKAERAKIAESDGSQELEDEVEQQAEGTEDAEDAEDVEDVELDDEKAKNPKAKNAFQKMRNELKKRDEEYNQIKIELARVQGVQEAMQKPQEQKVEAEKIPDKDYEPEEWYEYQLKQRDKKIEAIENQFKSINEQATVSYAERVYQDLESKYIELDPSYTDAKKYYKSERMRALRLQYPTATDQQIQQEVKGEEYKIVSSLAQTGLDSNAIFNVIKGQAVAMGYKDLPTAKKDNNNLKRNMAKSASLNDAPSANGDIGFSQNQMARMGVVDIAKLHDNPKELKKAIKALAIARMKANG
jgi:hypothetical protein